MSSSSAESILSRSLSLGRKKPVTRAAMMAKTDSNSYKSVKSLIRAIRNCKTAAEERDLISREAAEIRMALQNTSISRGKEKKRYRALAKLLCIQLLTAAHGGISVAFGQLDALKLMASPNFADKRLGHLGISLLLDSSQETLVLATNSFKSDLSGGMPSLPTLSSNGCSMYVTGLALTSLASLLTSGMAQELSTELLRLLNVPNAYILKKAVLAVLKMIRTLSDASLRQDGLYEMILERTRPLLSDRNHGVLLSSCALISELALRSVGTPIFLELKKLAPLLVRVLSSLLFSSSFPEYDVGGTTDPFLQVF
ncbi:subunit gamma-1 of AP-1 complex [Mitosporidium daphniae]|uniref:Subunit gamma-1 of AP-1 complex n=1 Tax=Mitosporidium daphniae TaxID=1485682 RepID=A0A098VMC4_9MICR|nr:subunit gamma-1 of AP-1 complex [Mitosporidium daphniae]XP_013236655.1 subunit gamma-1 of AP-1 complex [Mitosporidium daphniae]KGG50189.1 subunit gamma-1 of AP-1 complex [Mitosporidium daphniae]KGG50213.1 subunit gamma-1 of AP-1 complex [Mitosporidium daphniae]|eukprot:XP_013236632.1 subunit gamma-1 of AP-1 complex [Mitosporidium daphniae]